MVFITKKLADGITAEIELNEDTTFYTQCADCGTLVEETDDIVENFGDYLRGFNNVICANCTTKRRAADIHAK